MIVNGRLKLKSDQTNMQVLRLFRQWLVQWPSFTASLSAYFAHRELEIPASKRKSYKNLQDAVSIQWHRYIKKSNNICYCAKSTTEKYKNGTRQGHAFIYIVSIFARFLLTLLYVLIYGPGIWWIPLSVEFRSLLDYKLNKEFHTKRQHKQRTRSLRLRSESCTDENKHSSACQWHHYWLPKIQEFQVDNQPLRSKKRHENKLSFLNTRLNRQSGKVTSFAVFSDE